MMTPATLAKSITTAEQLAVAGDIGRCELVRGEIIMMSPASWHHGRIASWLDTRLRIHVEAHDLGEVTAAETGFLLSRDPDTVRAPDVAFVSKSRLKNAPPTGFFPGAPDLAVEVLSPSDTADDVLAKVQDWLEGGSAQVWVVDPKHRTVTVYLKGGLMKAHRERDTIASDELLRGFRLTVADLFG